MNSGGAEKVIANISNILSKKHNVTLKILYNNLSGSFYLLSDKVNIEYITNFQPPAKDKLIELIRAKRFITSLSLFIEYLTILISKYLKSIKTIKNEKSDIIISDRVFFSNLFSKYAPKHIVTIGQEHNHHNNDKTYINRVIKSCKRINYLMPASQSLSDFYDKKLSGTKIKYIPHSLSSFSNKRSELISKNLITVGRLVEGKGIDVLIDIFYEISKNDNEWTLIIIGDGPEKKKLMNKVSDYKLYNRIIFTGNLKYEDVESYYLQSSIYLSCSWTESFGLTFLEAASFGIPSITFNSAQGAAEIICDSISGFLIEGRNKAEYIRKTLHLMNDHNLRVEFGNAAYKKAEDFCEENVSKLWYNFIDNLEGS
jgi:glycosyltransferase involved in cell wall biosynthesis